MKSIEEISKEIERLNKELIEAKKTSNIEKLSKLKGKLLADKEHNRIVMISDIGPENVYYNYSYSNFDQVYTSCLSAEQMIRAIDLGVWIIFEKTKKDSFNFKTIKRIKEFSEKILELETLGE